MKTGIRIYTDGVLQQTIFCQVVI